MSFANMLIHTVVTQRQTATGQDGRGLESGVWATNLAALKCRIWQEEEATEDHSGRDTTVEDWRLVCAAGVDLLRTDRVKHGARTFEVMAKRSIDDSAGVHHDHYRLEIAA